MALDDQPLELPLHEALTRWVDPGLVEAIRAAERDHTPYEMASYSGGLLSDEAELTQPAPSDLKRGSPNWTFLNQAWERLERDFRRRMGRGEFHLSGVRAAPERSTKREAIPGDWAADCRFHHVDDLVWVGSIRFVGVRASRAPWALGTAGGSAEAAGTPITAESVRRLTDEEVLLLLEEHARRVVAGPDAKLIAPGKISLMPLVAGKLRDRAERRELLPTLRAEARWLAGWIASKVSLHQVPKASTISKVLGSEYAVLKARSNAAIQTAHD